MELASPAKATHRTVGSPGIAGQCRVYLGWPTPAATDAGFFFLNKSEANPRTHRSIARGTFGDRGNRILSTWEGSIDELQSPADSRLRDRSHSRAQVEDGWPPHPTFTNKADEENCKTPAKPPPQQPYNVPTVK